MSDPLMYDFLIEMRAKGWVLRGVWTGTDLVFVRIP